MANTVAYKNPATGATPPTAAQSRTHQTLVATVTGDGASTSFVITHNWGISAAQLALGFPLVSFEPILAAGITAAPFVSAVGANSITVTCTAFTGAGLQVNISRPFSMLE